MSGSSNLKNNGFYKYKILMESTIYFELWVKELTQVTVKFNYALTYTSFTNEITYIKSYVLLK